MAKAPAATRTPSIERNPALVLRAPQHYHATIFVFVNKDEHGNFVDSQRCDLIGSDVPIMVWRAHALSPERMAEHHVSILTQCHDATHIEKA